MNAARVFGIILILGGVLALVFGGFSFTENRERADLGPIELQVEEKETVHIPTWAGIAAVVAGGVLLIAAPRKVA